MRLIPAMDFETLVESSYRPVFHFALSLCGKFERALELTQHTFCLALSRQSYFGETQIAQGWLLTLLFREFLKEKRHQAFALSRSDPVESNGIPVVRGKVANSGSVTPTTIVPTKLGDESQIPLILFHQLDFSCSQIADYLGISMDVVLTRLAQGRNEFKLERAARKWEVRKNCRCPMGQRAMTERLPLAA